MPGRERARLLWKGESYHIKDDFAFWFLFLPTTDEDSVWVRWTHSLTEHDELTDHQLTVVL